MAGTTQVLVRDLDAEIVDRLKVRAERNGRSLDAELRTILHDAASEPAAGLPAGVRRIHDLLRGRTFSDSAELIREDRTR